MASGLIAVLGIAGSVTGIAGVSLVDLLGQGTELSIAVSCISLFAVFFLFAFLVNSARLDRKSQYAEAFEKLNQGFEEVHYLSRIGRSANKEIVYRSFLSLCSSLSEAFNLITGKKCSCCIKYLKHKEDGTTVLETLCRDRAAPKKRQRADKRSQSQHIDHTLKDNTAFVFSLQNLDRVYFSNYLPSEKGYNNTSFKVYGSPSEGPLQRIRYLPTKRYRRWPLPYRSTIVVPISPSKLTVIPPADETATVADPEAIPAELEGVDVREVIGYLCLDCSTVGVFSREYDIQIMQGVADGIYNTLAAFKGMV